MLDPVAYLGVRRVGVSRWLVERRSRRETEVGKRRKFNKRKRDEGNVGVNFNCSQGMMGVKRGWGVLQ